MKSILINNGKVMRPGSKTPEQAADVLIENGKIKEVGKGLKAKADKTIDAKDAVITPGLVDMHVHLREPGQEGKETIATATRAAAKGGVTTVLGMPNTKPALDNQAAIRFVLNRAQKTGIVRVLIAGSLTQDMAGEKLAEIEELKASGATMVIDDCAENQTMSLRRLAMQYCQTFDMPIMAHPEDADLKGDAVMNEGWLSTQLGLRGSPASTESLVVARTLELIREVGSPYHFTHITTKRTVELIRTAKKEGLPVTCDVTTHHIALTDEACANYNTYAKVDPPLRTEEDRQELLKGLKDGTIDAIISDHAPHLLVEKSVPFAEAAVGISGLDTLFPIAYTELVGGGVLTLPQLLEKLTVNPAKIMRIEKTGIVAGAPADLVVWNLTSKRKIDKNEFESKGKNTPFDGKVCQGWAREVIYGGALLVEQGKLIV
ncbi:MAG: dihydroorotase [Patescibacteria group bacterium]